MRSVYKNVRCYSLLYILLLSFFDPSLTVWFLVYLVANF